MEEVVTQKTADELEKEIREEVVKALRTEFEANYAKKLDDAQQKLQEENAVLIREAIAEWQKQQKPPSLEDMTKLLSQEYIEFKVKLRDRGKEREFVIQELPYSVEKKFLKLVKEKLVDKMVDLDKLTMDSTDTLEKLKLLTEMIDPAGEIITAGVVMVLNPRDEDKDITVEWVQDNISSNRMWNILVAQYEVNRLRDFFSGAYPTSRRGRMMSLVGTLS